MLILVKVANTQVKALRADVEKGSLFPALVQGLADPKGTGIPQHVVAVGAVTIPKGKPVNIPVLPVAGTRVLFSRLDKST